MYNHRSLRLMLVSPSALNYNTGGTPHGKIRLERGINPTLSEAQSKHNTLSADDRLRFSAFGTTTNAINTNAITTTPPTPSPIPISSS
eukprot:m.72130 g.72130  ORF g.72130 m.72130 type:complete len:88 (-) comp24429_c0_seq3:417-680(-)